MFTVGRLINLDLLTGFIKTLFMKLKELNEADYNLELPNGDVFKWNLKFGLSFNIKNFEYYLIKKKIRLNELELYHYLLEMHVSKIYIINP